jgi:hypothetical protein
MELETVPALWFTFLAGLGASEELAARLWNHVKHRDQNSWQLEVLRTRAGSLRGATTRTKRLTKILTPAVMMAATVSLEPEGHVRSPEIRRVEGNILQMTREGSWVW